MSVLNAFRKNCGIYLLGCDLIEPSQWDGLDCVSLVLLDHVLDHEQGREEWEKKVEET